MSYVVCIVVFHIFIILQFYITPSLNRYPIILRSSFKIKDYAKLQLNNLK